MRVRVSPVYGFGLAVIKEDEIEAIAELNGFEDDPCAIWDTGGQYVTTDEGDFITVDFVDGTHHEELPYAAWWYAKKQPKAFECAYANCDEVVKEFETGDIKFPPEFDFLMQEHYL